MRLVAFIYNKYSGEVLKIIYAKRSDAYKSLSEKNSAEQKVVQRAHEMEKSIKDSKVIVTSADTTLELQRKFPSFNWSYAEFLMIL